MKPLAIAFAVGVTGALIFTSIAASSSDDAVETIQLDEWSESSRKRDPVGFIEYELTRYAAEKELESSRSFLDSADQLSGAFRAAFQDAEAVGNYPAVVDGVSYEREELIEQTKQALTLSECFKEIVPQYEELLAGVSEALNGIAQRSQQTEQIMFDLEAEKTRVRLTDEASGPDLLLRAQTVLNANGKALARTERQVPKLEELLHKVRFRNRRDAQDKQQILDFLRSRRKD